MFEAFATGLSSAKVHDPVDALAVRRAVSEEISLHPAVWCDHYERKEQLKTMRASVGNAFLLIGAGGVKRNKTTCIRGDYKRVLKGKEETITYKQKNRLDLSACITYDKEPSGEKTTMSRNGLPSEQNVLHIENYINIVAMQVNAKGLNFDMNEGRCMYTRPSFKQLTFCKENGKSTRDCDGSSPVSFHVLASETGANAGTSFGNSITTSENYNKKERALSAEIKKFVGDYYDRKGVMAPEKRSYNCKATVRFENLIPDDNAGGLTGFLKERNAEVSESKRVSNEVELKKRFKEIGKLATAGLKTETGVAPQVQRVEHLTYEVALPNGCSKKFSLGRDTELYVHSTLHKGSKHPYTGRDLKYAKLSRPSLQRKVGI